jgi:4-amino-4-deoxy-L-arabinose transferase-like glycosyltransferase
LSSVGSRYSVINPLDPRKSSHPQISQINADKNEAISTRKKGTSSLGWNSIAGIESAMNQSQGNEQTRLHGGKPHWILLGGKPHWILLGGKPHWILLAGIVLFALLSPLPFGLTDLDEGFYASVAREMWQSGDWLTPTLGGEPWFEKPPLLYWCMTLCMHIFGPNEFALRLPSVLAYLLTTGMLIVWGEKRLGAGIGWTAGLLFALSPLTLLLGRFAITDMILTCSFTAALIALWEAARKPAWSLVGGLATGCAILTKGPIGIGFIGLHWLFNSRLLKEEGLKFRWVLPACIIALLVPVPWYVGIYRQHGGEFFEQFILKQNLLRFAGGDTAHSVFTIAKGGGLAGITGAAVLYLLFYVVVFWVGMYPSSVFKRLGARGFGLSDLSKSSDSHSALRLPTYLNHWFYLVFIFFTIGFTKLPAYIFPLFPVAALLIAYELHRPSKRHPLGGWGRIGLMLGGLIWLGVSLALAILTRNPLPSLFGIGLIWLAASLQYQSITGKEKSRTLLLSSAFVLLGLHFCMMAYDNLILKPPRALALRTPPERVLVVYKVNPSLPSLRFYRAGEYAETDKEPHVLEWMQQGAYCLTTDNTLQSKPGVHLVGQVEAGGRTFYLLAGRYNLGSREEGE